MKFKSKRLVYGEALLVHICKFFHKFHFCRKNIYFYLNIIELDFFYWNYYSG